MHRIQSERLVLRAWTDADRPAFHKMCSDADVMHFVGNGDIWSREQSDRFIDRNMDHFAEHGFCQWAVEFVETGKLAGYCGFVVNEKSIEMGWRLGKAFHGRGFGTEAAASALLYADAELTQRRIFLTVQAPNRPSIRITMKLGFRIRSAWIRNRRAVLRFERSEAVT